VATGEAPAHSKTPQNSGADTANIVEDSLM
jgi:hypothetical protein